MLYIIYLKFIRFHKQTSCTHAVTNILLQYVTMNSRLLVTTLRRPKALATIKLKKSTAPEMCVCITLEKRIHLLVRKNVTGRRSDSGSNDLTLIISFCVINEYADKPIVHIIKKDPRRENVFRRGSARRENVRDHYTVFTRRRV